MSMIELQTRSNYSNGNTDMRTPLNSQGLKTAILRAQVIQSRIPPFVVEADEENQGDGQDLVSHLFEIAGAIAAINKARLSCQEVGERVGSLEESEQATVEAIIRQGVDLATHLQERFLGNDEPTAQHADIFLSHPGEEKCLYVKPVLLKALQHAGFQVFFDQQSLQPLETAHPHMAMIQEALRSRLMISVCTYHTVQKKWPVAELLCGLARNKMAQRIHRNSMESFAASLLVDAFPGHTWLQSAAGQDRNPLSWIDDLKAMFSGDLMPTMMGMKPTTATPCLHALAVAQVATSHLRQRLQQIPQRHQDLKFFFHPSGCSSSPGRDNQHAPAHPSKRVQVILAFLGLCAVGVIAVGLSIEPCTEDCCVDASVSSGSLLRSHSHCPDTSVRLLNPTSSPTFDEITVHYQLSQTLLGNKSFGRFGAGMALDGDTLVVGEPELYMAEFGLGPKTPHPTGQVQVFRKRMEGETVSWVHEQTLKASTTNPKDGHDKYELAMFGSQVALQHNVLVVGGSARCQGSICYAGYDKPDLFIFQRNHTNSSDWKEIKNIGTSFFGEAHSYYPDLQVVNERTILVNAGPEGLFLFQLDDKSEWGLVDISRMPEVSGSRIVMLNDLLVAGSMLESGVRVYRNETFMARKTKLWTFFHEGSLVPLEKQPRDMFGASLCMISETLVAVGAPNHQRGAGAVFLFSHDEGLWAEQGILMVEGSNQFGFNCAVAKGNPNALLVAATGAVHLFQHSEEAGWELVESFFSPNAGNFGFHMAITQSTSNIFISAPRADETQQEAGAVYVYTRRDPL